MEKKFVEEMLDEVEVENSDTTSSNMEATESDLFDVLMGRCPPSSIVSLF